MNGIHDMGGMDGFGSIRSSPERLFHDEWERRLFGCFVAILNTGLFPVHKIRHANERMPPKLYLASSYYERWLFALETCLTEGGYLTEQDGPKAGDLLASLRLSQEAAIAAIKVGHSEKMEGLKPATYRVGSRVRVSDDTVATHTRVPRYVRGKIGTVVACHGGFVFPDIAAHSGDIIGQHLYTIRFESELLWGSRADRRSVIFVDLFEPYLATVKASDLWE
jgi:nitrile hydratase beta subunit